MRISTKTIYDAVKFNLGQISEALNKANKVASTGKRITTLSDDPVGLVQSLHIKSDLSNIEQMGRNITFGKSWLVAVESALSQVQDLISDAKSLCIQMSNASTSAEQRVLASENIRNILEGIVSLANTEINGRYIFAGSETDTAPFTLNGNAVTYNGDDNVFAVSIGRNTKVQLGFDGNDIFRPSGTGADDDIFKTLSDLKTALEDNSPGVIKEAMDKLDVHFEHISAKISSTGSRMVCMEMKEKIFQDLELTHTERISRIEDADITSAIMHLKQKELAYQAALASSGSVMKLSLIDYL